MKLSRIELEPMSTQDLEKIAPYQDFIRNHKEHPLHIDMSKHSLFLACLECGDTLKWLGTIPNMSLLIETENENNH